MINVGKGKEASLRSKDCYSRSRESESRTIKDHGQGENLEFDFSHMNSNDDKKQGLKMVLGFSKVPMIEINGPVHFIKN